MTRVFVILTALAVLIPWVLYIVLSWWAGRVTGDEERC